MLGYPRGWGVHSPHPSGNPPQHVGHKKRTR
nr:MAG TPA: hypothetical protein [Caudoviricetes sp.]DAV28443.1 MAG TPA: hypothetical protein [Caudoviricetes sp.]